MNIIDLCWCTFYRHEEKHDIGLPPLGATISMAFFIVLYALNLLVLLCALNVIDYRALPPLNILHIFGILAVVGIVVFLGVGTTKEKRERKLKKYEDYKKAHPRKRLWRFWLFVGGDILFFITSFALVNILHQ